MGGMGTKVRHGRSCVRAALTLTAALAVLGAARSAAAQNAAAQDLYEKASALLDESKYAEACPLLEEVVRMVPDGLGAKLTLAACYEGAGKLASAWSQYAMVEAAAGRLGQAQRQHKAGERAAALRPRLATLTLKVPEGLKQLDALVVKQDGLAVGSVLWGQPQPVDVGHHVVVVSAPGMRPFEQKAEVTSDGTNVDVDLPQSLQAAAAVDAPDGAAGDERAWQLPVAIATAGAGVALLAIGGGMGGLAMSRFDESNQPGNCDADERCTPAGLDLRQRAIQAASASTGLFVAGGVLAAVGGVLLLTLPSGEPEEAAPKPERSITLGPGFATVRGSF